MGPSIECVLPTSYMVGGGDSGVCAHVCVCMHMCVEADDNLQELVFPFYSMSHEQRT